MDFGKAGKERDLTKDRLAVPSRGPPKNLKVVKLLTECRSQVLDVVVVAGSYRQSPIAMPQRRDLGQFAIRVPRIPPRQQRKKGKAEGRTLVSVFGWRQAADPWLRPGCPGTVLYPGKVCATDPIEEPDCGVTGSDLYLPW